MRYMVWVSEGHREGHDYFMVNMLGDWRFSGCRFFIDLEKSKECINALNAVNFGSRYVLLYNISGGGHYHNQLVGLWQIAE